MRKWDVTIINYTDIPPPPTHRNWKPLLSKWQDLLSKLELWNLDPVKFPTVLYVDADIILLRDPTWIFQLPVPYDCGLYTTTHIRSFTAQEDAHKCSLKPEETKGLVCSGLMLLHPDR